MAQKVYIKCTTSACSSAVVPPLPPEPLWVGDHLAQAPARHPLPAGTALHYTDWTLSGQLYTFLHA